jgi:propanediol dehydratase small subunit
MGSRTVGIADYPLAEKRPDLIRSRRGKPLEQISLDNLLAGKIELEDLRIAPETLKLQADIARAANRPRLAENFERAAEMVDVPQAFIMEVYELLRPGRAKDKEPLLAAAKTLRETYGAERMALFVEEAAAVYDRRKLFTYRF